MTIKSSPLSIVGQACTCIEDTEVANMDKDDVAQNRIQNYNTTVGSTQIYISYLDCHLFHDEYGLIVWLDYPTQYEQSVAEGEVKILVKEILETKPVFSPPSAEAEVGSNICVWELQGESIASTPAFKSSSISIHFIDSPCTTVNTSYLTVGEIGVDLINEFRTCPVLYDHNCAEFKDKMYKAHQGEEVPNKLGFAASILKDRRLQLRNRFIWEKRRLEHLRSEENPNTPIDSQWPLYKSLHFLSDHIRERLALP
uniref:MADF domain-containing protein n=1 Tax=Glossina austeni TaxID=7395 RepID=A0A1A9V675_GLOAU